MSCANKQPISAINANAFEAPFIGAIGAIASRSSLRDLLAGKWLYIFGDSSGRGLYLALYQQLVADAASYDNDSTLLVLPGQADPGISAVSQLVRPQTFGRHASTCLSIVSRSARLARRCHCHHCATTARFATTLISLTAAACVSQSEGGQTPRPPRRWAG